MNIQKFASPAAAAAAAALMSLVSHSALATVICDTPPAGAALPLAVPMTTAGIYLNFVTGAFNVSPAAVPGWDLNPFSASGAFTWFWSTTASHVTAGLLTGGIYDASPAGVVVGPGGTFSTTSGTAITMAPWQAGVSNLYQGVRFTNEAGSVVTYGWVAVTTTGPTGFPATLNQFCYQSDGTAITTGATTPVRLQDFSVD
jgi:hypothetical protein